MKVLTVEALRDSDKATADGDPQLNRHVRDILKLDSASSYKAPSTADLDIHSKTLPFHLEFIGFRAFVDVRTLERTRFGKEIQGGPFLRSPHPNDRKNETPSSAPSSRNAHEARSVTTQDAWHAPTGRG